MGHYQFLVDVLRRDLAFSPRQNADVGTS